MIVSFGSKGTEQVFNGEDSSAARKIPHAIWRIAQRKMDMLNAAVLIEDMRVPPGNRLEMLKGDLKGMWSVRINDQYRLIFTFKDGNAYEVEIIDYH